MSLCSSCGSEVNPEKKYCDNCGEPLKTDNSFSSAPEKRITQLVPPPPPPPSSSLPPEPTTYRNVPTPIKPEKSRGDKIVLAGIVVVAIIATLIYTGFPWINLDSNKGTPVSANSISQTSIPTSIPTTSSPRYSATLISPTAVKTQTQTTVYLRGVAYDQINLISKTFNLGNKEVFSYNVQQLPMVIQIEINPAMVSDKKLVDIGTSNERYITATYADPAAWFELKVINSDSNTVETTMVYRKNVNGSLKQEYTIRTAGNYRFEMSGHQVQATVQYLAKKS